MKEAERLSGASLPEVVRVSDNGPQFASKHFRQWVKEAELRFHHIQARAHHPQSSGMVEGYHQSLKYEEQDISISVANRLCMLNKRGLIFVLAHVITLTALASILPDVIAREVLGLVPVWLTVGKVAVLLAASLWYIGTNRPGLARYAAILLAMLVFSHGAAYAGQTATWRGLFDSQTFAGYFGSAVLLKFCSTLPLVALLLYLFRSRRRAYLVFGNLSVKAEPINWLRIGADSITWRRLAVLSAFAISGGTLLLTLLTVTGFARPERLGELPDYLPVILLLALVNSLSEGFMFRNAILAPLCNLLPKDQVLLVAAAFFGMAHFYGAPSGIVGVLMSAVLGWYMTRSMYETGGLLAPWIIHFMQDVVIFAILMLLGQFI